MEEPGFESSVFFKTWCIPTWEVGIPQVIVGIEDAHSDCAWFEWLNESNEASGILGKADPEANVQSTDNQAALATISSLHFELSLIKSEICNKIEEKIMDMDMITKKYY